VSDPRPIILLTRAKAQSERLAQALQGEDPEMEIAISPVLEIVFHPVKIDLTEKSTFIATSENGLLATQSLGISLSGRTVWCVGPQTAQVATEMGANALVGPGDAQGLAKAIIQSDPKEPLIYLRGEHVSVDLEKILFLAGIETVSHQVYSQTLQKLNAQAKAILAGTRPVILPLYSQMSALRLCKQIGDATAPLLLVAISTATAKSWNGPKPKSLTIAQSPTNEAMLRAIRSQFE
jgi:uroporphyrinogen-III synthase